MSKAKKPHRMYYEIRQLETAMGERVWAFVCPDGSVTESRPRKDSLVADVARELRRAWEGLRVRSELVIKDRHGRIQDRRTYGDDPRSSRG